MYRLNWRATSFAAGLFFGVTYVSCVVYGLVVPPALHAASLLEMILPGFRWLTPGSFLLGLAETVLYGAYAGAVFAPLYNFAARRVTASPA